MDEKLIERLRELLANATPTPWQLQDGSSWRRIGTQFHDGDVLCPDTYSREDRHPDLTARDGRLYDNLRLIVEGINALPELLAALESLSPPPEGVERLRELSKKATQGPWYTDTERSEGEYGRGPDTHSGYDAYLICAEGEGPYHGQQRVLFDSHNSTMTEVEEDQHADEFGAIDAWDAVAKANAEFIVACVDHVRQALNSFDKGGER